MINPPPPAVARRYLTPTAYAAVVGSTPSAVRRDAAAGRIPGAVRISSHPRSPWALPDPLEALEAETTTAGPLEERTGRAGHSTLTAEPHERTSTPGHIDRAVEIAARVSVVTTRPARALVVAVNGLTYLAGRHTVNRDGACAACGWTYPCPDAQHLAATLERVAGVVGVEA